MTRSRSRRRTLRIRVLLVTIIMVGWDLYPPDTTAAENNSSQSSQVASFDWPQFLGPTADGKSPELDVNFDWPASGPPLLWSCVLGDSYGMGTTQGPHYFQADYESGTASLVCLNRITGKQIWRYAYESKYVDLYNYSSGPRTSPVVDLDGDMSRVYFYGVEGLLICIDAKTGKEIWKRDTVREFNVVQNFFGVGSTPAIFKDLLIVAVGGSPKDDLAIAPGQLDRVSGNGTAIVAFDKRTGQIRYRLSDELASYASPKIVIHDGRAWCFAFMRGGLLAFDPESGKEDFWFPWRARILESVNASNPVVWDDFVFISETYGPGSALLQFSPGKYQRVWDDAKNRRNKAMQTHWNTPIYHDGYLYGSSGRHSGNAELRCIKASTGEVMWTVPGLSRASLLYVNQHFVCLTEDGTLRLIKANRDKYDLVREFVPTEEKDGTTRRLLKYPAWAAPILSNGLLYVRGSDRLACFDLRLSAE